MKKIPATPEYARAILAMKEKAIELAPQLMHNYAQHIQNQNRVGRFLKSGPFKIAGALSANYAGIQLAFRFYYSLPLSLVVYVAVLGAGIFGTDYVGGLVDRKADAERHRFERAVKAAFYSELKNGGR